MKFRILIFFLFAFSFANSQTVINSVPTCKIDGNPNLNAAYNIIDQSVECGEMIDTITGDVYKYIQTKPITQRWVLDVVPGNESHVRDTITQTGHGLLTLQPVKYSAGNLVGVDTSGVAEALVVEVIDADNVVVGYRGTYTVPSHAFTIDQNYYTPAVSGVASDVQFATNYQFLFKPITTDIIQVFVSNAQYGGSGGAGSSTGNTAISNDQPNDLIAGSDGGILYHDVDTVCRPVIYESVIVEPEILWGKIVNGGFFVLTSKINLVTFQGGPNLLSAPVDMVAGMEAAFVAELNTNNTDPNVNFTGAVYSTDNFTFEQVQIQYTVSIPGTENDVTMTTDNNGNAGGASNLGASNAGIGVNLIEGDYTSFKMFDPNGNQVGSFSGSSWQLSDPGTVFPGIETRLEGETINRCGNTLTNYFYYDRRRNELTINQQPATNGWTRGGLTLEEDANIILDGNAVNFTSSVNGVVSAVNLTKDGIFLGLSESVGSISGTNFFLDTISYKIDLVGDSKFILSYDAPIMTGLKQGTPIVYWNNPDPANSNINDGEMLPLPYALHTAKPPNSGQNFLQTWSTDPTTSEVTSAWSLASNNPADIDWSQAPAYANNAAALAALGIDKLWVADGTDSNYPQGGLYVTF